MASSNDGSNKGPTKSSGDAAPKKPSALIDLKATEVDIRDPKKDDAKPSAGGAASGSASTAAAAPAAGPAKSEGSATSSPGKPMSGPSTAPANPGTSQAASAVASAAAAAAKGAAPAASGTGSSGQAPKASPPASHVVSGGGGLRGAATHLVAGLAGGLLALLGADVMLPKSQIQGGSDQQALQRLEARLAGIEAAKQPSGEVAQKIASYEQKLAQVERLTAELKEQQGRLAGQTKEVGERLAAQSSAAPGADAERIAKLEETLTTLSAAAANDPQKGRIPQIAQLLAKVSDLEGSLATQLAALRKSVTTEVDSRLGQSSEAAQAARAGTQRLDRELAGVKTEAAQIVQRFDGLKAQADRADVALKGLGDEAKGLKAEVGAVRDTITRELKQVARPTDVSSALSPLTSKLTALEQNVQGVVRGEDDRRANVERIVVALELGNLKRTVERGAPFAGELSEVKRIAGPKLDLSALERFKDKGVASLGELEREFRPLTFRMIEADAQPADAHWTDRLIASAKSVVRVRKVDQTSDDESAEARVARMEQSLKAGKLAEVVSEAGRLSDRARSPAQAWLEKVNARAAVESAITAVEQELKSSLGASSQPAKKG